LKRQQVPAIDTPHIATFKRSGAEMNNQPTSRLSPQSARFVHRTVATLIAVFCLYFGITGFITQSIDVATIVAGKPATSPNMKAIRESLDGPPSFAVIDAPDYDAPALPRSFDYQVGLQAVSDAARTTLAHEAAIKFVELRMMDGKPVGTVSVGDRFDTFDAVTGQMLATRTKEHHGGQEASGHLMAKRWHRLWLLTDWMVWLNALVGVGLGVLIVTGLVMYFRLWRARAAAGRAGVFWSAGGWLKSMHRGVALVASVFLMVVAVSGALLSFDSFVLQIYRATHNDRFPEGMNGDFSSPLRDSELQPMLKTTLAAYRRLESGRPIKVVRLRYFSGTPQGVIVSGGEETEQFVFNALSGAGMTTAEPGYPDMGFPFGWWEHEIMKKIHRGDIFGLPGRLMDLLAGLALIFLSASGIAMYLDLWKRRRGLGRKGAFWR
jgi:hypothetical protein